MNSSESSDQTETLTANCLFDFFNVKPILQINEALAAEAVKIWQISEIVKMAPAF